MSVIPKVIEMPGKKVKTPSFMKIMSRDFTHHLRIPHPFSKHFDEKLLPKKVYIKNHNGDRWVVEVKKGVHHLFFKDGWRRFVKNNHIQENDALMFRRLDDSMFSVKMYDSTGCEKQERIHKAKKSLKSDKGKGDRYSRPVEAKYASSDEEINFRQDVHPAGRSIHKAKQSDKCGISHREKKRRKKVESIPEDDSDLNAEEHQYDSEAYTTSEDEMYNDGGFQQHQGNCSLSKSKVVKRIPTRDILQKESEFKSRHPFFKLNITPAFIGYRIMRIPNDFVESHMPNNHVDVSLLTTKGKLSSVEYKFYKPGTGNLYKNTGFKELVSLTKARIGGLLAFELIDIKNMKFKVTALRK